jgi:hypothetical protein
MLGLAWCDSDATAAYNTFCNLQHFRRISLIGYRYARVKGYHEGFRIHLI